MSETTPSSQRWEALDLLRGLSVIGMLLNLFPGDWAARYGWLDHAKWNGATLIAILVFYAALLLLVPVPGIGAPRLDQYGAWPSQVDRAVFGTAHLWEYGFAAGSQTVVYDPDGLLSTLPVCFNLLAALARLPRATWLDRLLIPVRAYGGNPLRAFILCWSLFPWLDVENAAGTNLRAEGQSVLVHLLPPEHASMLFGLLATALLAVPILYCQRRGWFLRL